MSSESNPAARSAPYDERAIVLQLADAGCVASPPSAIGGTKLPAVAFVHVDCPVAPDGHEQPL